MTQEGFNGWSALTDDGNFFQLLRLTFIKRKLTQTVQMLKYILTVLLYGLISTIVFWRLTWPFTCKISIYFQKGLVMP